MDTATAQHRQYQPDFYLTACRYPTLVFSSLHGPAGRLTEFASSIGTGVMLFAKSRRRLGWSEARIAGYLLRRGLVLIVLQVLIENPAWLVGMLGASVPTETHGSGGLRAAGKRCGCTSGCSMAWERRW